MAAQLGGQPIFILREGTERSRGKEAQNNNIMAAKAVANAVRTTLGPKGMDKMLVDSLGDVVITNDGVTILREMDIEHPAAKMMVEVAKTQDDEVGDGTTTAAVLAGELLKVMFILTAMFLMNFRLAILTLVSIPVFVIGTLAFRNSIRKGYAGIRKANSEINTSIS